jgi:hypothetical protein
MILAVPESKLSRRWVTYLDDTIREHISHQEGAYLIDIDAMRECGVDTARTIEEATKRFGAEKLNEN